MKHSFNVFDFTAFIQNILISISIIAGGFWAWYKFIRRNEVASLSVKIEKAELIKGEIDFAYLSTEVILINHGDREVKIYYDFVPKECIY